MVKLDKWIGVTIPDSEIQEWIQEGLRVFRNCTGQKDAQYICASGNTLLLMTRIGDNGVTIQVCTVRERLDDWDGDCIGLQHIKTNGA